VALFPTTLGAEARQDFYLSLKTYSHQLQYPVIHLRDDMSLSEWRFLCSIGGVVFTLHSTPRALDFVRRHPYYARRIFVENGAELDEIYFEMLARCAGATIDLAHLGDFGFLQQRQGYDRLIEMLPSINVGITHISAVWAEKHEAPCGAGGVHWCYEEHFVRAFPEDLEYLHRPEILDVVRRCRYNCIELDDTIGRQLAFIQHIKRNILGQ
jgi:hypothetical protein